MAFTAVIIKKVSMNIANLILQRIIKDPARNTVTQAYLPLLLTQINKLLEQIKLSQNIESTAAYFDELQAIQDVLAELAFKHGVKLPDPLKQFVRDCDRLDDHWLRNHLFELIKNNQYHLASIAIDYTQISQSFGQGNKIKLYWLIQEYTAGNIDTETFCNEFVEYYNTFDTSLLTPIEYQAFSSLNPIAGYFSNFKEDFNYSPQDFYTEDDLKAKVVEIEQLLKNAA